MLRIAVIGMVLGSLAGPAGAGADEPSGWRPAVEAARAYAQQRSGTIAFAVRTEGRRWGWHGTTTFNSASVVKGMILVAYLRRPDVRSRTLRGDEVALLSSMITRSDNDATSALFQAVGTTGLGDLAERIGMRRFVPSSSWGLSSITAADQARFFLRIDRAVPGHHRGFAMRQLRGVVPWQRWGIPAALPNGWRIAFKGGWGYGLAHQAALLRKGRMRVSLAVLTADNPDDTYGYETIEGVARRLVRGLNHTLVGEQVGTTWAGFDLRVPAAGLTERSLSIMSSIVAWSALL